MNTVVRSVPADDASARLRGGPTFEIKRSRLGGETKSSGTHTPTQSGGVPSQAGTIHKVEKPEWANEMGAAFEAFA